MEMLEPLDVLNTRLIEYFGLDTITGDPIFRIVWSDDQYEKRLTNYTADGFELLYPEVREFPKYRQWIHHKYLLERLVVVPAFQQQELADRKVSYEPLWVFEDRNGNPLPPKWEPAKFVIDSLHAALGKQSLNHYVESEEERNDAVGKELRVHKLEEELFGNESPTGDALANKQSTIIVPRNFKDNN